MVYKKEYLEAFLKNQSQLFDEPVAETLEEADAFLDDCMAVASQTALRMSKTILRKTEWIRQASRKRSCSKNLRCLRFRMENT